MHAECMHGWMESLQVWVERVVDVVASPRPGESCQQGSDLQHNREAWRRCHGAPGPPAAGGARVGWRRSALLGARLAGWCRSVACGSGVESDALLLLRAPAYIYSG